MDKFDMVERLLAQSSGVCELAVRKVTALWPVTLSEVAYYRLKGNLSVHGVCLSNFIKDAKGTPLAVPMTSACLIDFREIYPEVKREELIKMLLSRRGFYLHNGTEPSRKVKGYHTVRETTIMENQTLKRDPSKLAPHVYGLNFFGRPLEAFESNPNAEFISLVEGSERIVHGNKGMLVTSKRKCLKTMSQKEVCRLITSKHFKPLGLKGLDGREINTIAELSSSLKCAVMDRTGRPHSLYLKTEDRSRAVVSHLVAKLFEGAGSE